MYELTRVQTISKTDSEIETIFKSYFKDTRIVPIITLSTTANIELQKLISNSSFEEACTYLANNKDSLVNDSYTITSWLCDYIFCLINILDYNDAQNRVNELLLFPISDTIFDTVMYFMDRYCIKFQTKLCDTLFENHIAYLKTSTNQLKLNYLNMSIFIFMLKTPKYTTTNLTDFFDKNLFKYMTNIKVQYPFLYNIMKTLIQLSSDSTKQQLLSKI